MKSIEITGFFGSSQFFQMAVNSVKTAIFSKTQNPLG